MRIYLAGPLFTQAERDWNLRFAERLEAAGHRVFLPQTEVKAIATLEADAIFQIDIDGVRGADAVVAIVDGADPDSGTPFEAGVAFALGIPLAIVRTDFRAGGDALPGQKLGTINLMIAQAASAVVNLPDPSGTLDELAQATIQVFDRLPSALEPLRKLAVHSE